MHVNEPHECMLSRFSHTWLFVTPWTVAHQAPLSMGFSRQEYWRLLLCPPPGNLPDPGIKPMSLGSPALADRFFTTSATWEALHELRPGSNNQAERENMSFCEMNFGVPLLHNKDHWIYYLARATITQVPQTRRLQWQKCMVSQFHRPEIWNQVVDGVDSLWGLWGRILL